MDPLKLFATYETGLNLIAQAAQLRAMGWQTELSGDELRSWRDGAVLLLESSGDELYLLRGDLDEMAMTAAQVIDFLRGTASQFQLDIYEEDGRLIRRVSSLDQQE